MAGRKTKKFPALLKVRVTEDDVRLGKRHSASRCPLARALCRRFRLPLGAGLADVCTFDATVRPSKRHTRRYRYRIPSETGEAIVRYDREGIMPPGEHLLFLDEGFR